MQDSRRNENKGNTQGLIKRAFSLVAIGLALQACQTSPYRSLTADEWNARTNAVQAFTNSVNAYTASQRPVYGQPTQYRAPTQQNPFLSQPAPQNQPEHPLFGPDSMFGQ